MNQLDYHCGVIDAFNEMIACGVKKMALSHPFDVETGKGGIFAAQGVCDCSYCHCLSIWRTAVLSAGAHSEDDRG